jgi:hypothetical protein
LLQFESTLVCAPYRPGNDDKNIPLVSVALEFALPSLAAAFDEQYESIPDDEVALLVSKF